MLILIASIHGNNILHGMTTVRSLRISCAQAMNMILIFIRGNDMAIKSLADRLQASEGTSTGSGGVMLPGQGKFGVVISKIPVMQSGLKVIFNENLPDYELSFVVLMMSSPFYNCGGRCWLSRISPARLRTPSRLRALLLPHDSVP